MARAHGHRVLIAGAMMSLLGCSNPFAETVPIRDVCERRIGALGALSRGESFPVELSTVSPACRTWAPHHGPFFGIR